MLYRLVRPLATIALKTHFRKIYFHNQEAMLMDKPVLLAVNHPTAFIEPCVLACFQPKPLHFLVRGDLFVKRFYIKLLNSLHMVPMFRLKDGGYQKLKRNYETLEFCFQALRQNKTVMILAEGSTKHEKRLRPLRKGTARIAFGAVEKYPELDIYVVPVGVNYTYAERFREEVMIDFGKPLRIKDYLEWYQKAPAETMRQLLTDLKVELEERIVIIDRPEDEELVEQLFVMARNDASFSWRPTVENSNIQLQRERWIALQLNQMPEEEKQKLKAKARAYFNELDRMGLHDLAVAKPSSVSHFWWRWPGAILYALGYGLNYPPIALIKKIVAERVKSIEFKMSVALALGIALIPLYWLICWAITTNLLPFGWLWGLLIPLLGYIALRYRDHYLRWKAAGGSKAIGEADRARLTELRELINIDSFTSAS